MHHGCNSSFRVICKNFQLNFQKFHIIFLINGKKKLTKGWPVKVNSICDAWAGGVYFRMNLTAYLVASRIHFCCRPDLIVMLISATYSAAPMIHCDLPGFTFELT